MQKKESNSETAMEDSSDSACDLDPADVDSILGFLLNVQQKGLLRPGTLSIPLVSFLLTDQSEIRKNCAKLMLLEQT